MTALLPIVGSFVVLAGLIIAAGTVLARAGDVIAARTNLGGAWFGSVFLALATSLPELLTDIAAIRAGALDLAVGDLFGSGMANMLLLGIVSLVPGGGLLFHRATLDHAIYACLGIVVTMLAAIALVVRPPAEVLGVGVASLGIVAVYALGSFAAFRLTTTARAAGTAVEMAGAAAHPVHEPGSLPRALASFAGAVAVIVLVAPRFAHVAEQVAVVTGLGTTFVGTWLVGLATSLPELVTSLAAVRLRAFDLAVGNLLGSNAINMTIFALLDPVHRDGPVLAAADPGHLLSALVVIGLMATAVGVLVAQSRRPANGRSRAGLLLVAGYVLGIVLLATR
jgi:cation:H+ antiporter